MTKPLTGIPADEPRSYASIERIAAAFRENLGLEVQDKFDALKFFNEDLGDLTLQLPERTVVMVDAVEDCPQEGLTRWDSVNEKMEIVLAARTYEMLLKDHVRARSTVAHEAGHAVLHTNQIIRLAGMNLKSQVAFHRDRNPHKAFLDTEWQANAFGSALLMPAKGIEALSKKNKKMTPELIAKTYGVSPESASYRILSFAKSLGL